MTLKTLNPEAKKHPCPDCTFCQWCGDDRCALCLRSCCGASVKKLSVKEQIALYDEINCDRGIVAPSPGETVDELKEYSLRIIQPENGYRFSLDPLLLCNFVPVPAGSILDLGTGCGIMPLVLARKFPDSSLVGVEVQPEMAELARRNVELNQLTERISILEADILDLSASYKADSFDLVIANPPYRRSGTGKISPKKGRDLARHESTANLADFLSIARKMVKPEGRIILIYHPERLPELMAAACRLKLSAQRLQMVHGSLDAPARMFMIELFKGRGGALQVLPVLLVR